MMETYSDEYIEFWADKFICYGIRHLKNGDGDPIEFEAFLKQPLLYVDALLRGMSLNVSSSDVLAMLRADRAADVLRAEFEQIENDGDEVRRPIRWSGVRLMQRLNPFAPPKLVKCGRRAKPCA